MLYARTNAEAHLYMDLHTCECGSSEFERDSILVEQDDDLVSVYEGNCRSCGRVRKFEFLLSEGLPPTGPGVVYGGNEASSLLDPGEFMRVSDEHAERVPGTPDGLSDAAVVRARRDIAVAIAGIEECLKFIPADKDRVPADAFRRARSKEMYLRDPGRWSRLRLEAVLQAYRGVAAALVH